MSNHTSHHASHADPLRAENIRFAGVSPVAFALLILGVVGVGVGVAIGMGKVGGVPMIQVLAAYHAATMGVLATSLAALFFSMIFLLVNAGWTATLRRQFENIAGFLPFAFLMVVPTLIIELMNQGVLFAWLKNGAVNDYLLQKKWSWFYAFGESYKSVLAKPADAQTAFPVFFVIRAAFYGLFWFYIARRIRSLSLAQDTNPNPALTAQARRTCAWGILVLALTTAFASFDWLMALDYRFFSTMWPVYFFAGGMFSAAAVATFTLAFIRLRGKLEGAVTTEHFHDLGKLMFAFTVFWAYISFSQYFLIWYSNIPEETSFFIFRGTEPGWRNIGVLLIFGHFVVPFLILLFRGVKKNLKLMMALAVWAMFMHMVDMYWIVRPMAFPMHDTEGVQPAMSMIVDLAVMTGVVAIFAGFITFQVPKKALVAVNDPWMPEALQHHNYV